MRTSFSWFDAEFTKATKKPITIEAPGVRVKIPRDESIRYDQISVSDACKSPATTKVKTNPKAFVNSLEINFFTKL